MAGERDAGDLSSRDSAKRFNDASRKLRKALDACEDFSGILMATRPVPRLDSATHCERDVAGENCAIDLTPEMIEAGATAVWEEVGGAEDLGTLFSASDLAAKVFAAMWIRRNP